MKKLLLVMPLLAVTAAFLGCSSPAAGNRPHDGGMDVPLPRVDSHPVDYYCPADAMGGGVCPINFCGTLQTANALAANPPGYGQSGADSICNSGRVCVVGSPVAAGNAFQLDCVAPAQGALAFGAACGPNGAAGVHCANDSLCIASPDFPTLPFCSTMCRNDADCPASSSCLEYSTANAPDGSPAMVGYCTPASKIAANACARERDCPSGQGCVSDGSRTSLTVCKATTATKTVGTKCGSSAECLSGACFDRNFTLNGGTNRTYCSAICAVNSDCGPDQMCARIVQNNNGTPSDPTDDVVVGECQTLFIPIGASGCGTDSDCLGLGNGSDTCDVTHGLCYNKSALPGSACAVDSGCPLGGVCSMGPRFPGGYCQTYGCAPNPTGSTPGADLCAGAGSVCAQRGGPDAPLYACYDGCQVGADASAEMCMRATAGYFCDAPVDGQPASICLGQTGT
ncbi:MAG TPA: hypothetical protein VH853_06300 [Polyangia bacterium]|jgi:hypothetical protein|nr:hypothetical protein [Polyangia bacterium]